MPRTHRSAARVGALALACLLVLPACERRREAAPSYGTPAATAPAAPSTLEATVQARLDSLPAQSSFYARDLRTGREVAVRADQPMNTVSVIKLAVMVQAYRDADAGRLRLSERHRIRPEEMRQGSGVLRMFTPGLEPTYRDLITQMIATSDNTASDILIGRVGRDRVNHLLDSLGYRETRLRMRIGDLFRGVWVQLDSANVRLTDRQVFDRGFPDDSATPNLYFNYVTDSTRWFGRSTAREIGLFLEQLELGRLASNASTEEMRRALLNQVWDTRLPQRIGERVPVGHKTGDWEPQIGNDVGIVFAPNGPIVMAAFTNANTGPMWRLNATLGRVAEDVLDAWARGP
jgi:beta-lactamase class A